MISRGEAVEKRDTRDINVMLGKKNKKEAGKVEEPIQEELTVDILEDDDYEARGNGADSGYEAADETSVSELVEVDPELIVRLETEAKESYDKYLRSVAEFENYKKRAIKDRADLLKYAGEGLARDLLEVLDDLERALNHTSDSSEFITGVKLIRDRLVSVFDRHGIKGQSSLQTAFDPNIHQALASVPTAEVAPNMIIEEFKKAYFYKDKLLRVGQVVVSAAPVEPAE